MFIDNISVINYRNLSEVELSFSSKINCLIGSNGMGKTNLLDAVYYLSFCKSALGATDNSNIRHGEPFFMIKGNYVSDSDIQCEISCGIKQGEKKQFRRDKKVYERLADHIGTVPLVLVSPSDNELVTGGSEERRRFMDVVISQYNRDYLLALMRYNRAMQQRNAMLRGESVPDAEMLSLIDEMIAPDADIVYRGRCDFVEELTPIFKEFYSYIAGDDEEVSLRYRSHLADKSLQQLLRESRADDLRMGYTTKGLHRDELVMQLGGYPIRKEGSQGQNKSYLVSLKLAQFDFLRRKGGETPLLLLDDIFDKLDSKRVEKIVALVSGDRFGQIFITDVNREHTDSILECIEGEYKLFEVTKGSINIVKER